MGISKRIEKRIAGEAGVRPRAGGSSLTIGTLDDVVQDLAGGVAHDWWTAQTGACDDRWPVGECLLYEVWRWGSWDVEGMLGSWPWRVVIRLMGS